MKKAVKWLLPVAVVAILVAALCIFGSAQTEQTVSVSVYDGQTLLGTADMTVGSAPAYSGDLGRVYEGGVLKKYVASSFFSDAAHTSAVTEVSESTSVLYVGKTATAAYKWATYSSTTPSLDTLVGYSESDNEIYGAVLVSNAVYIEAYADVKMTVPSAAPKLEHDLTVELNEHVLSFPGAKSNYGINPGNGTTMTFKNGTLTSASAQIIFPFSTNCTVVYDGVTVNFSGSNLLDYRSGGTFVAKNSVFNLNRTDNKGHAFFMLNNIGNRALNATFEKCVFNCAEKALANSFFNTGSSSLATSSLNLSIKGCTFNIGNPNIAVFEQGGASPMTVTVGSADDGTETVINAAGPFFKHSGTGAASFSLDEGVRLNKLIDSTTAVNTTVKLPTGSVVAVAQDASPKYIVTDDYCTVTFVEGDTSTAVKYQKGYSGVLEASCGYEAATLNGVAAARQTMIAWLGADGKPVTAFAPTSDVTLTGFSGVTDVYADWVIFNSDSSIYTCSLASAYLGQTDLPTTLETLIPTGGVLRLFKDMTLADSAFETRDGVTLDLNGHRFSMGGYINLAGSKSIEVRNGTFDVSPTGGLNVLIALHGGVSGKAVFDGVELITKKGTSCFDFRGGELVLNNCTFNNSASFLSVAARYKVGYPVSISVTDCDITCGKFFASSGNSSATTPYVPDVDLTVTDTVINCSTLVTVGGKIDPESVYDITLDGVDVTTSAEVLADTVGADVTVHMADCRFTQNPETAYSGTLPTITYAEGQAMIEKASDGYSFVTGIPVFIEWSLTLYTDFDINLYVKTEGIDYILVNGTDHPLSDLPVVDGSYLVKMRRVPANLVAEDFTLKVGYGGGYSVEKTTSIAEYAAGLFTSGETVCSKTLVASAMGYIDAAYAYARAEDPSSLATPKALADLLAGADYLKYAPTESVTLDNVRDMGNISIAIESAQLDLASQMKYRFNLNKSFTGTLVLDGVSYSVAEGVDTATSLGYVVLDIPAYKLASGDIEISGEAADGTVIGGRYSLATYIEGVKAGASAPTLALLSSLSTYVSLAEEYKTEFDDTKGYIPSAEVVNKNGADGVVTYVIDDGNTQTGGYAKEFLEKYDFLRLSFAIPTKHFATLATTTDEDGNKVYVMTADGKYTYTVNESFYNFWKDVMSLGRSEIVSHSHTHAYWGLDDEGGTTKYVNSSGVVKSSTQPKGSSSKELYAPIQILEELFPVISYPIMKTVSFIIPGISVKTSNVTVDGVTYKSYYTYFRELLENAIADGTLIGTRNTFQVKNTTDSASKVTLPSQFATLGGRYGTNAYMIVNANKGTEGIENWTAYIDHAIEKGGWACFCIHEIRPTEPTGGHFILKNDADALFGYVADKNVWVATYTEAMTYYCQWSTSQVAGEYRKGSVFVTLTDKENDEIFDAALTVKVAIPSTWQTASCNGISLTVHENADGSRYVLVDIVPDGGEVEITK